MEAGAVGGRAIVVVVIVSSGCWGDVEAIWDTTGRMMRREELSGDPGHYRQIEFKSNVARIRIQRFKEAENEEELTGGIPGNWQHRFSLAHTDPLEWGYSPGGSILRGPSEPHANFLQS